MYVTVVWKPHFIYQVFTISCFFTQDRSVLFKPLTTSWTIGGHTDPTVIKARLALLCRVITAAVSSLPDTTEFKQVYNELLVIIHAYFCID